VYRFHELLEFILCFSEEPVKISQLPCNKRHQDDEVNKLCLGDRYSSQTKHGEEKNNADKYPQFESFKHGLRLIPPAAGAFCV
jgi:hypothetical protein